VIAMIEPLPQLQMHGVAQIHYVDDRITQTYLSNSIFRHFD